MSVALVIDWPDGGSEVLPLGSHRQLKEGWGPMASELGLRLIPHFYSFLPLEPSNLDQVMGELTTFREYLVSRGSGYGQRVESVDRLTAALQRLKESEGWSASIG